MCGIAGVLYADPHRRVPDPVLRAMGAAIAHRGPDADGFLNEPGVGLAHRRLSIIDLEGGDQPLGNEDGSVQIVFNGEIYNYRQLRESLQQRGHVLRTRSDTEVLVHLYEDHGDRLVEHLRGMFAFALWDKRTRRLLLARDRIGIKPLYIYRDAEKLIFGSEIKAILAHPDVDTAIDTGGLEDYLAFGMVVAPRTIFRAIQKLPSAHTVTATADALDTASSCYWRLRFEADERTSVEEWREAIYAKIGETVQAHLIADVPVGAFLSGGVDSSVIVATAAKREGRLQTFSIGFNEEKFSELPYAAEVAAAFGTEHRTEIATPDAVALIDLLVHHYDEPFADSSAIPTLMVARLASRSVKVVLSGDGGDEAFGGYPRYADDLKEARLRRWLPPWVRSDVLGPLAGVWPKADWLPRPLRAKTLLTNLSLGPADAYANSSSICRPPLRRQLMAPHLLNRLNGHLVSRVFREAHDTAPADDALAGMIAADVAVRLPDDYLVKVDRASMAFGLEVRPPLLDHELLEMTARIPSRLKIRDGETKWVFKDTYRERLPPLVTARRKQGFEIPLDAWMRGPLRGMFEDLVLGAHQPVAALVDQATARRVYRSHLAGTGRHGSVLWSLLILAQWANRYRPAV
jgi:asparagine synthase (glutamine-hydrolysing)